MRELLGIARRLGVSVHLAHIDDDEELLGYYVPGEEIVVLRFGMTQVQSRCVLAHELAHKMLDHPHSADAYERQADRLAASMLIHIDDYLAAELIYDDVFAIAEELGVTPEVVKDYRDYCLERIGNVTYEMPRMGQQQWTGMANA